MMKRFQPMSSIDKARLYYGYNPIGLCGSMEDEVGGMRMGVENLFAFPDLYARPDIVESLVKARKAHSMEKFCHNCAYCHYFDFDYGLVSFYICGKHDDRNDIEYDTAACEDFENKEDTQ